MPTCARTQGGSGRIAGPGYGAPSQGYCAYFVIAATATAYATAVITRPSKGAKLDSYKWATLISYWCARSIPCPRAMTRLEYHLLTEYHLLKYHLLTTSSQHPASVSLAKPPFSPLTPRPSTASSSPLPLSNMDCHRWSKSAWGLSASVWEGEMGL